MISYFHAGFDAHENQRLFNSPYFTNRPGRPPAWAVIYFQAANRAQQASN
jgi:hypothetical protein